MQSLKWRINNVVEDIPEALSIYINQMVYVEKRKGIDVITLSLGEAFFDIPKFSFSNLDFIKGYHYSDSLGLPELREKIRVFYNERYNASIPGIDNIMISSGSKAIIFMTIQLLVNPGDEVLIHEPAWLSYQEQVKLVGGIPKFIPYSKKTNEFKEYISPATKLLILNNPNNPAGWVYKQEDLVDLHKMCLANSIFMLMDEAYSDFVDENEKFVSLANVVSDLNGIFIVNSLSKNMGMSGWRIGYVIAEKSMILQMLKLNQHIITCAPTILQMYLAYYFDAIIQITLPQAVEVTKRRKKMLEYMDSIGLKYLPGGSTFYIFVDVNGLKVNTIEFCLYLLFKYAIATVPGVAYGASTDKFIRVGIGVESEERLRYAFDVIKSVLDENTTDVSYVRNRLRVNGFYMFGEVKKNEG